MTCIKLNFHIVRQTVLLFLMVFSLSVSYANETVMKLIQVAPQSYYVEGASALGSQENKNFISNAGVVIAPEGVVVIDALGSPALAEMLVAEIKKLTPKTIQHVIVTHYHADHVYGLQVFADLGAKIIGISKDIPTKPSLFKSLKLKSKIINIKLDIRNNKVLKKKLKNINLILYFI